MKNWRVGDIVVHKSAHDFVGIIIDTNPYQTIVKWGTQLVIYPDKYMVAYIKKLANEKKVNKNT